MDLPAVGPGDVALVAGYALVLLLPGGALAALAGLRGWSLVAAAPLVTYAVAGLAGPALSVAGLPWTAGSAAVVVAVLLVAVAAARAALRRRGRGGAGEPLPPWSAGAHTAVAAAVAAATAVGAAAVLGGIRTLSAVPQDWDAAFHANGIRLIADTGDGGLYAMATTNWYEDGLAVFYPNAYHLVATAVLQASGTDVPTVLNAHTVLVPGLVALSLVALLRRYGAAPLLAVVTALAAVSVSAVYDLLWRGPLLPFAAGLALTPVIVVLVRDLLDAPSPRVAAGPAALFAAGVAGLLCLHPAILVGAVLFTVPAVVQRWWQRPAAVLPELGRLVAPGLVAALACSMQLAGAVSGSANLAVISWPVELSLPDAVGQVLTFAHGGEMIPAQPQLGLAAALAVGLVTHRALGELRWVGAAAAVFGALFVVAAAVDTSWARTVTSLWWNDRWRLIALTAVPLCVVVGHGVAQSVRAGTAVAERIAPRLRRAAAPAVAVAAVAAFVVGTNGLYLARDQARMSNNSGDGPAVSPLEIAGMREVAAIVPPDQRVLNDRGDGSVWLYALTGRRPVAAHYDAYRIGPDAELLAQRFRDHPTDPAVRAAVARLGIRYVLVNDGFLRTYFERQPGFVGLEDQDWLTLTYANPDLRLYEIAAPDAAAGAAPAEVP